MFLKLICLFLCFSYVVSEEQPCSQKEIKLIQTCYDKHLLHGSTLDEWMNQTSASGYTNNAGIMNKLCVSKKEADACVGNAIIEKCFDVENLQNLSLIDRQQQKATEFLAVTLIIDYYCSKLPSMAETQDQCVANISKIPPEQACQLSNPEQPNCQSLDERVKCNQELMKNICNKAMACFFTKVMNLINCGNENYVKNQCGICSKLSVKNNPIDSLCTDDVFDNGSWVPTTEAIPTTPPISTDQTLSTDPSNTTTITPTNSSILSSGVFALIFAIISLIFFA